MNAPPIQYVRTEDDVQLAYWTLGKPSRPALVVVPWGIGHLTGQWAIEQFEAWYRRLAASFFLVAYDARGSGLSTRGVRDLALDRFAQDLATVVTAARLERYALYAKAMATPPAVLHAHANPAQVSHLVLWAPVDGPAFAETRQAQAIAPLRQADWDTYRHTVGSAWTNWSQPDLADRLSSLLDQATDPANQQAFMDSALTWDVRGLLSRVAVPTLVAGIDGLDMFPLSAAQDYAADLPDARLIITEGLAWPELSAEPEAMARTLEGFIIGEAGPDEPLRPGLRTILFTDLESSTAVTQSLGDAKAQELLRGHNDAVRGSLQAHGGEEVKHTGDGIMAAFGSAVSAVQAAIQIQRDLADAEVRVRVGLNAGEPIHEDDDYFGSAVQLAARVCDRAEPGQVVVTQVVRDLVRGKGFQFDDIGAITLKGFPEPERLFVVGEGR